jgi:hypothetical protein
LNERLTATELFKKVCQKVYWIWRSLRPHSLHSPFQVRRSLVVSLSMPHIGYRVIVYVSVDTASQRRFNISFRAYLHAFSEEV